MRSLTKTGIRILSAKYRSILIKCAIINASMFIGAFGAGSAFASDPVSVTSWADLATNANGTTGTAIITIPNSITRDVASPDGDITISKELSIIGSGTGTFLDGGYVAATPESGYKGLTIGADGNLTLENITMKNFKATQQGGAIENYGTANIIGAFIGNLVESDATALGGAIYNDGNITNIKGNFTDNSISSVSAAGGAIYNNGSITNIEGNFKDTNLSSTGTVSGGVIYNNNIGNIDRIKGDFIDNSASGTYGSGGGIFNLGTISSFSGNFVNNSVSATGFFVSPKGGAIYNGAQNAIINILADNGELKFDGNYVTSSSGQGGAIYNTGTVGLYADTGHSITFVGGADDTTNNKYDIDGIYNGGVLNINGNGTDTYAGTVSLQNVDGTGTTNIYGGTVNALADIAQSATNVNNATLKLGIVGTGEDARAVNVSNLNLTNHATLDAYNGHIDTTEIKSINSTATNPVNVKFDVDLANKTGDYNHSDTFNITTFVEGSKLGFAGGDVNFISDMDSAYGKIKLADKNIGTIEKIVNSNVADSKYKYLFKASNLDGSIDILRALKVGLREYVHNNVSDEFPSDRTYTMNEDEYIIETLGGFGTGATSLTVDGTSNHYGIIGNGFGGITVGNGKTLTIKNVGELNDDGSIKSSINSFMKSGGYGGFIIAQNGGIVNVENSVISSNTVSRNNAYGGAIFNMGNATGLLKITDSAFIDNQAVKDDSNGNGGAIYNYSNSTTNILAKDKDVIFRGNISGDGTSGAIYNAGTLGLYAKENKEIAFEGTKDGVVSSTADTIYNSGTININGNFESVDYKGTINLVGVTGAGTMSINGGTVNAKSSFSQSTLHNEATFNFNPTDTTKTGEVTTLSDATNPTGTTNIQAGSFTVNSNATQKKITVLNGATLTTKGNVTTSNGITNDGTLNLLGGSKEDDTITRAVINSTVSGDGTTNFGTADSKAYIQTTTDKAIAQAINLVNADVIANSALGASGKGFNISDTSTLTIAANNIMADVANSGTLNLGAGTLAQAITGTGTITTTGNVSSNASYLGNAVTNDNYTLTLTGGALNKTVTGGNVTIAGDVTSNASIASAIAINGTKSLSIDADNVGGVVTNDGTLTLTGGTLEKAITGGDVAIDGVVTSNASIASAIAINSTKSLSIDAYNVGGVVTNAGTLNLGAGTLAQAITGTGTIATTGDVASNASNLGNVVTNTGHTLTLTGGALNKTVTGGNVTIDGEVTSNASIASAIAINGTKSLSIDAYNVGGAVTNAGTLNLGTGTLAQNVNGDGTTNVSGEVVVAANKNIINTVKIAENSSLELNADLIDATKANITQNLGTAIMNGGTLSSNVAGAYETKVGGNAVTTTTAYLNDNFTNKGTLNLTSDIDKDIKGNGTTILSKEGTYVSVIGNRKIDGVLNSKGKTIDMQSPSSSVSYNTLSVGTLNLGQDISLMLDSNIVTQEIDKISADAVIGDGKINMLLDIPNRIDTVLTNPNITLNPIDAEEGEARTNLAKALRYDGHSITSPIFEYTTNYDENTGLVHIAKKTGTDGFNKYLYAPSVVANTTAAMTTQIATLAMDKMDDVVHVQGRSGGDTTKSSNAWVKVMGLNDNVEFKNFENVDSKALTVAAGYNTNKITCGDNSVVFGAYAGYIGGKQHYTANDIDQDGGYIGLSSALTLGDAFLTATVNGGLLKNKANNMYGSDRFNTLWLGTGLKAGYNYAITDSVVLQPNVYGGYTLVNTQDYTSVSGVKIATDNLNFFEVDPGLKLSAVIADGWTGSVQGKYAIVMDNGADITANDIALQNISTKNYIEYGIGIDKSVTDAFYLGAKINRHDGGRTGWNGSIEFRYKF